MAKAHRIAKDVKEQILKRIREDGISVAEAARDHGVSEATIYNWLSKGLSSQPTHKELRDVKKQNRELLELVGELTIKLSQSQKKI